MTKTAPSIAIIGAGIIGLSCAWELSRRGAKVTIYEKDWPPRGASWAAAGMLAPAYEAAAEDGVHPRLFDLCMAGAEAWPEFASELEAASGLGVGYHPGPSLAVAVDADQAQELEQLRRALERGNVGHHGVSPEETNQMEPSLSGNLQAALALTTDGQVDNRAAIDALIAAVRDSGVGFGSDTKSADIVIEASGWQSAPCDPVKGQLLSVELVKDGPRHVIQSGHLYIVPKPDRIVIGATSEPGKTDCIANIADTDAMLAAAIKLCPALAGADVLERWAGLRPATPDRAPIIGKAAGNRWVATGHYRNGILLAPITAKLMADMILDGKTSDLAAAFSPDRFASATA